jgi:hypothetical protein
MESVVFVERVGPVWMRGFLLQGRLVLRGETKSSWFRIALGRVTSASACTCLTWRVATRIWLCHVEMPRHKLHARHATGSQTPAAFRGSFSSSPIRNAASCLRGLAPTAGPSFFILTHSNPSAGTSEMGIIEARSNWLRPRASPFLRLHNTDGPLFVACR